MSTGQRQECFRSWASPRGPNFLGGRRLESDPSSQALEREAAYRAVPPLLCSPAPPEQAAAAPWTVLPRGLWWEPGLLGWGRVSSWRRRHPSQVGMPFLTLFSGTSFSHAGGQGREVLLPRPCPPSPPAPPLLRVGEGTPWKGISHPMCVPLLLEVGVPQSCTLPTYFPVAKNNIF